MKRLIVLVLFAAAACTTSARAQTFGPDSYGYTGNHTTGNTFTQIKGNGGILITPGSPADPPPATLDDRFYSSNIGFNFPFYGVINTSVFESTNGFISFGGTTNTLQTLDSQITASYTNGSFATNTLPLGNMQVDRAVVAPWWDDMQFTAAQPGGIYVLNRTVAGKQEYVIEWNNVAFFNATANGVTFQIVLRDDGSIDFNYIDVVNGASGTNGASATIGIHNLGGTLANNQFLQWTFNQAAAVSNGDLITFTLSSAVPEPATMALGGLALGGVLVTAKRVRARRRSRRPVIAAKV